MAGAVPSITNIYSLVQTSNAQAELYYYTSKLLLKRAYILHFICTIMSQFEQKVLSEVDPFQGISVEVILFFFASGVGVPLYPELFFYSISQ